MGKPHTIHDIMEMLAERDRRIAELETKIAEYDLYLEQHPRHLMNELRMFRSRAEAAEARLDKIASEIVSFEEGDYLSCKWLQSVLKGESDE